MKMIIFDLDGVISDTEKLHYKSWEKALSMYNIKINPEIYARDIMSKGRRNGILNVYPSANEDTILKVSSLKANFFNELINEGKIDVFDDALELIGKAKECGVMLSVASASSSASDVLNVLNLNQYFDFVLTGEDVKHNKPNPEIYNLAVQKTTLTKSECLIIEDSFSGIQAAMAAGVPVIGINRTGLLKQEGVKIVNSLNEIDLINMI